MPVIPEGTPPPGTVVFFFERENDRDLSEYKSLTSQVCCVHPQTDGQACGEERIEQTML